MQSTYKPKVVEIEMSHLCNLRCPRCAILPDIQAAKYALTAKKILAFLSEAKEAGVIGCGLTGGEPFLHLPMLEEIIAKSPIDVFKINTNGFIFTNERITEMIFGRLQKAGFGQRNTEIKAGLHISIGQQNQEGVPLENAVIAGALFYNYFPKEWSTFSLNVFSDDDSYSKSLIEKYLVLFKNYTGTDFDLKQNQIRLIAASGRSCSTAIKTTGESSHRMTVENLIHYYIYGQKQILSCTPQYMNEEERSLCPRMMLRANGDIFTCAGFAYVHKLGNIYKDTLSEMLSRANENEVVSTVFDGGLPSLLKLAKKYDATIATKKISVSNGPCDICRLLRATIQQAPRVSAV